MTAQRYLGVVGLTGGHGDGELVEQAGGDALGDGGISSNGWKAIWQIVDWSFGELSRTCTKCIQAATL